jgi:hypothetical protein
VAKQSPFQDPTPPTRFKGRQATPQSGQKTLTSASDQCASQTKFIPHNIQNQKAKTSPWDAPAGVARQVYNCHHNNHTPVRESQLASLSDLEGYCPKTHPHYKTTNGYPQDRLTRVQRLFPRNLSPLQPSKSSFEYSLLSPRSAPGALPVALTRQPSTTRPPRPPT